MIPHGHVHRFTPFASFDRPDGRREVASRCECGPGTVVEQKLVVNPDGTPYSLRYRFGGLWFDPLDLVRLALPIDECGACRGAQAGPGMPTCGICYGIGVTAGGSAVAVPELTTA